METIMVNLLLCFIEYFGIYIFMHKMFTSRFSTCFPMIITATVNSLVVYYMYDFSAVKIFICVICFFVGSYIIFDANPYI